METRLLDKSTREVETIGLSVLVSATAGTADFSPSVRGETTENRASRNWVWDFVEVGEATRREQFPERVYVLDAGIIRDMVLIGGDVAIGHKFFNLLRGQPSGLPESLSQRLREFSQLPEGWDSYGARPITPEAVDEAKSILLRAIRHRGLSAPFVAPTAPGGIGLEWKQESGKELLLEISPSGEVSYLLVLPRADGGEDEIEDAVTSSADLEQLLKSLEQ